jgi:hypothetical protein
MRRTERVRFWNEKLQQQRCYKRASHLRSQIGMSLVPSKWQAKDAVEKEVPAKRFGSQLG